MPVSGTISGGILIVLYLEEDGHRGSIHLLSSDHGLGQVQGHRSLRQENMGLPLFYGSNPDLAH